MDAIRKEIYHRYNDMIGRCYRQKNKEYFRYGGRGIVVDNCWLNNFESFYEWAINNGYDKKLSIDRIDTNSNYSPNNCRWVSMKEQANNTRRNRILVYKGVAYTMENAANIFGINSKVLQARLNNGWDIKDAIEVEVKVNFKNRKNRLSLSETNLIYELLRNGTSNSQVATKYNITEARVRQIKAKL